MSRIPHIGDTLPETQQAYQQLTALAAAKGIRFALSDYGAARSASDTTDILGFRDADYAVYVRNFLAAHPGGTPPSKTTWRPIAPYGSSYHDFGAAFDIAITAVPAGMTASQARDVVGQLAPQAGLRWGASFNDPGHFELAISLPTAAQWWHDFLQLAGHYALSEPPKDLASSTAAAIDQALNTVEESTSSAVNRAVNDAVVLSDQLTGGLPPIATALIAAAGIGILGALVLRRLVLRG